MEAEACFLKAIEIPASNKPSPGTPRVNQPGSPVAAARQKAEAHKLLSEVYNWFTEGFDTKDLQEAKALIEELSIELRVMERVMKAERQEKIFKEIQELKRRLSLVERKAAALQKPKPASVRKRLSAQISACPH